MTLKEFKKILDEVGYPVAYHHFSSPPQPPYIVYLEPITPTFVADNKTYHKMSDVQIELYTKKRDLAAEAKVEKVLDENEIPYVPTETYIASEGLFQKTYEVRLI
jgi:hypothetical protein